jgi:benzoyl-CoA reductase/2-hydroxyglutaryl-CoA dehydratase subunit BcrC/BadD/HgdB
MYEILNELKPTHVMHLPQGQEPEHAFTYWKEELMRLKEKLEDFFNVKITDEILRKEIKERNRERKILMDFYELGKLNPSPISGSEINETMEALSFQFDRNAQCEFIAERTEELRNKYERELKGSKSNKPRILVTGCPVNGVRDKILRTIENSGASIVAFENCSGVREKIRLANEDIDPMDALTKKYLDINCSVMTPNPRRLKDLDEMIDEYEVDGVVDLTWIACHTYNVESYAVRNFVRDELGLPFLQIETDYSDSDVGQIKVRTEAFLETMVSAITA